MPWVRWLEELDHDDAPLVGGKNAALGEMVRHLGPTGLRVPEGVAVIADAYRRFLRHNDLERPIERALASAPGATVDRLAETSALLRRLVLAGAFPDDVAREVRSAYRGLSRVACDPIDASERAWVAVRSSVVLPEPHEDGCAGQHDSYLCVHGEEQVLDRVRRCWASLFHVFALSARADLGVAPGDVAMSVGIQRMVQAGEGCSGEAFTRDPRSGDPEVVVVTSSWGLGEDSVGGHVGPDAYYLHKEAVRRRRGFCPVIVRRAGPKELEMAWDEAAGALVQRAPSRRRGALSLEDEDVVQLARWAVQLEDHWSRLRERRTPVDLTWARDGGTGQLFIVGVRPALPAQGRGAALPAWGAPRPARDPSPPPARNRLRGAGEVAEEALTRLVEEAASSLPPDELPPSTL